MADRSQDHREVEAVNTAFYQAFESADLDTMLDLWLEDPETLCVHPGALPVRGTSAINRSWALIMANTPYIQFFLTDVEVSVLPGVASVTCTENVLTGDDRTGPDAFGGARAVATNVFVRTEQGWRLWIHHASPVLSGDNHDDA
ncbi:nuclear transport factor 2 family protein [Nocardioides panacis]|uniref:Nuclear transport factor 2 family protein n=1 Tax=Nocardioides panacis TaxID=2849501 RepID=A0A975SXT9_9ACTN|nr:nuclear transport factor 2 family protein [Nocardioides panacis]QWZ07248.1 nuclear transport factor 2 family protein [Nocardioides panacis]